MNQPTGKIDKINGFGTLDWYTDETAIKAAQKELAKQEGVDHWGWTSAVSERHDTIPEFLKPIRVGGRIVRVWGVKCFTIERKYWRVYHVGNHANKNDRVIVGALLQRTLWIAKADGFESKSRTSRRHAVNGVRAAIRRSEGGS